MLIQEGIINENEDVKFWMYTDGGGYKFIKFEKALDEDESWYTDSV